MIRKRQGVRVIYTQGSGQGIKEGRVKESGGPGGDRGEKGEGSADGRGQGVGRPTCSVDTEVGISHELSIHTQDGATCTGRCYMYIEEEWGTLLQCPLLLAGPGVAVAAAAPAGARQSCCLVCLDGALQLQVRHHCDNWHQPRGRRGMGCRILGCAWACRWGGG